MFSCVVMSRGNKPGRKSLAKQATGFIAHRTGEKSVNKQAIVMHLSVHSILDNMYYQVIKETRNT